MLKIGFFLWTVWLKYMNKKSSDITREFFVNRWRHPVIRWRKRLRAVVAAVILSLGFVFAEGLIFSYYISSSFDFLTILGRSVLCVSVATALTFMGYYIWFRYLTRFQLIQVRIKKDPPHE